MPSIRPKTDTARMNALEQSVAHHSSLISGLQNETKAALVRYRQLTEAMDNLMGRVTLLENRQHNMALLLSEVGAKLDARRMVNR